MKAKEFGFSLLFQFLKSKNEEMKEKGGGIVILEKAGRLMNAEKSIYSVGVAASVEGIFPGADDSKDI